MDSFRQELKFAVRSLLKNPSFSLMVVATLALGIGANTAIFSILHALVLRNLPVADPGRLVVVTRNQGSQSSLPFPLFRHLEANSTTLDGLVAFRSGHWRFTAAERTERISGVLVSGSYFTVLGIRPALGTLIGKEDDTIPESGGPRGPVAVLSHGFWMRRYGGQPTAIGALHSAELAPLHHRWRRAVRIHRHGSRPDAGRVRADDAGGNGDSGARDVVGAAAQQLAQDDWACEAAAPTSGKRSSSSHRC